MLTSALRKVLRRPRIAIARGLLRLRVRPWQVTVLPPLVATLAVAPLLALGAIVPATIVAVVVCSLDAVDGTMARIADTETPVGRFTDVMADRTTDSAILVGVIVFSARRGLDLTLVLCAISASVWQLQSQTTIAAEAIAATIPLGAMQRTERLLVLFTGLTLTSMYGDSALEAAAAVLITGGGLTLIYRWQRVKSAARSGDDSTPPSLPAPGAAPSTQAAGTT